MDPETTEAADIEAENTEAENTETALHFFRHRLVAAALTLDRVASHYRVRLDPSAALLFAELAPDGNALTAPPLRDLTLAINALLPRSDFGPGNPNTGLMHHAFDVGRENSRVLYLNWPKSYAPKGFDFLALIAKLAELARDAEADEFDLVENSRFSFEYRIWWD